MATQVTVQREPILPNINLDEKVLSETAFILNRIESEVEIMRLRTDNYHYNVVSPRAYMLCELFKQQSTEQACAYDKVARHIRGLGFKVPTLAEKLRLARIDLPKEGEWPDCNTMITTLLQGHETIMQNLCKDKDRVKELNVKAVEDLILELERCHMQWAWQLRAHIQNLAPTGGRAQH